MEVNQQQQQQFQTQPMKKQNNHRVNFLFFVLGILIISACGQDNTKKKNNTTDSMLQAFEKGEQFYFSNSIDSVFIINANKGTRIDISPNSFVFEDGTAPTGEINVLLKEFYSPSDFIFSKVSMQHKNNLLETRGMIFFEAKSEGKILKLKEGKTIKISFPVSAEARNMNLYTGTFKDGYIKWDDIIDSVRIATNDTIILEGGIKGISYATKLDYYSVNTKEVKWLFCGMPLKGDNSGTMTLAIDTAIIPDLKIVFNNIKTIGIPVYDNGKLIFYNLPLGEKATLFGFYQEDGAKFFMCKKDIIVGNNMTENVLFKEVTLDQLKAEVETIKW